MSDELIQQVPQQSRSNAVPGLITGAAIGGVGGWAGANYKNWGITTKPDLDKVFKQTPDTFKRQIEKGGDNKGAWETAQEWANKIKESDAAYDKEVARITSENSVAKDPEVEKKLTQARAEYNAALAAEKAKYNNTGYKFDPKPYADLTDVKIPSGKTQAEFEAEYKRLFSNYQTARANIATDPKYIAQEAKVSQIKEAFTGTKGIYTLADSAADKAVSSSKLPADEVLNRVFEKQQTPKLIKWAKSIFGKSYNTVYDQILDVVKKDIAPLPTELTNEQIKALGTFVEEKDVKKINLAKKNLKATEELVEVKGQGYVIVPKGTSEEALKAAIQTAKEEQAKVAEEILGTAKQHAKLNQQLKAFPAEFVDARKKILENAKLTTNAANIEAEISALDAKNLEADLKALRKHGSSTNIAVEQAIADKYKVTGEANISFDEAIKRVENRIKAKTIFDEKVTALKDSMKLIEAGDSRLVEAMNALERIVNKNKSVRNARKALRKAFPDIFPNKPSTLTEDEITKRIDEALKDKKSVVNDLEKQAKEKGTELTEKGKKLIEDLGSKESYSSKVKEDAKKAVEPLLEKLKLANKTYTGIAAAAVLGLAGLLIGASNNKDA